LVYLRSARWRSVQTPDDDRIIVDSEDGDGDDDFDGDVCGYEFATF